MEAEAAHHVIASPGIKEIYTTVHVLVLGAIIYFGGRRGIMAALKSRSEGVAKRLHDSRAELARVEMELKQSRADLADMAAQKKRILSEVAAEGEKMSASLISEATQTANRILSDAKLAVESESRAAVTKLKETLVREAVKQSARTVNDPANAPLREKLHSHLLEEGLMGIGNAFHSAKVSD